VSKVSITLDSLYPIKSIEYIVKEISRLNLSLEIAGEQSLDKAKLRELIYSYGININGITGRWGKSNDKKQRKLISLDKSIINNTIKYVKDCIDLCSYFNGTNFNLCLFSDESLEVYDKNHSMIKPNLKGKLIEKVVPILRELASYGQDNGVEILIEPLNRYNTPYCSTANDGIDIVRYVDHQYLQLMLDTFHMNIEETSFEESIILAKPYLKHIHLSDSNRKLPGKGHVNFTEIIKTLSDIGYSRYFGLEAVIEESELENIDKDIEFIEKLVSRFYNE
jgi:D-psicose/D-tagatose/L-ribulose 3-epimerase